MKRVNIITKKAKRNIAKELERNDFVQFEGKLEVAASKNGKVFHYDAGSNVVTVWAKHATMHLLTGESFSSHGNQREFVGHDLDNNPDGTILSGRQYFQPNGTEYGLEYRWSKSTASASTAPGIGDLTNEDDDIKFPYFPTKMLFGTGFEWATWAEVPQEYKDIYIAQNTDWPTIFETNIGDDDNDYSDTYVAQASAPTKTRTMNDVLAAGLSQNPTEDDFAVRGAVKNGLVFDRVADGVGGGTAKLIEVEGTNEFSDYPYRGIGKPSFIYSLRNERFMIQDSEVGLSSDAEDIENKITFTVNMQEQTGTEEGWFYPYNGFILKQAGLFCDARMLLGNTVPISPGVDEYDNYSKMPYGIIMAKRNIAPIQKSHDVAISSRWTLYL